MRTNKCVLQELQVAQVPMYLDDGGVAGDGHSGQPSGVVVGKQSSDLVIAQ